MLATRFVKLMLEKIAESPVFSINIKALTYISFCVAAFINSVFLNMFVFCYAYCFRNVSETAALTPKNHFQLARFLQFR